MGAIDAMLYQKYSFINLVNLSGKELYEAAIALYNIRINANLSPHFKLEEPTDEKRPRVPRGALFVKYPPDNEYLFFVFKIQDQATGILSNYFDLLSGVISASISPHRK